MFYSNQNDVNSDYYNAYGNSNRLGNNQNLLNTMIKILAIIFLVTLITVGYIFISKERGWNQTVENNGQESAVIDSEPEISSVEVEEKQNSLSAGEIAQIVQIVMLQLDKGDSSSIGTNQPEHKSVVVDDDSYAKALMSEDVDEVHGKIESVDIESIDSQKVVKNRAPLKDINHYNKVIIKQEKIESITSMDTLSRLSTELEELMEGIDNKDSYTQSISEEIEVRSNEMRIIIVKRGDTLSNIAKRAYGDYDAYPKIFAANPEVIQNPDQIFVGQRLRIPL